MSNMLSYTYIDNGKERDCICLHGWGVTFQNFRHFLSVSEKHVSLYLLTLPGYLDIPAGKYQSIEELSERYVETVKHIAKKDTILLSHSMGTLITLAGISELLEYPVILNGAPLQVTVPRYAQVLTSSVALCTLLANTPPLAQLFCNIAQEEIAGFSNKTATNPYQGDAPSSVALLNLVTIIRFHAKQYIETIRKHNNSLLVYGEYDSNKTTADYFNLPYKIIPNTGHGDLEENPEAIFSLMKTI